MVVRGKRCVLFGLGDQQVIWMGCSPRYRYYMINVEACRTKGTWNYGTDVTMPH